MALLVEKYQYQAGLTSVITLPAIKTHIDSSIDFTIKHINRTGYYCRTTVTVDNEWVWLNINWGWVGG